MNANIKKAIDNENIDEVIAKKEARMIKRAKKRKRNEKSDGESSEEGSPEP